MKGRIIGREGRNIRAFEATTGVNLIIDDTPEAVVLSCFDPVRRETARMTLEKLVADGRIHPARIEEVHERSQREIDEQIQRCGRGGGRRGRHHRHPPGDDQAPRPAPVPDLVRAERPQAPGGVGPHRLGASRPSSASTQRIAKRGAFLHDIGKAVTHEVEGSHAIIGAEIARRLKEAPEVVHCIESHHGEVEQRTIDAVLAQIADAHLRRAPGRAPREPRDLREAPGAARGDLHGLHRRREDLRHAGRPRGPRHGRARGRRRPGRRR